MILSKKNLRNAVVVITGASSGIGRATAHAFARLGATVILAARGEEALLDTLTECEKLGGRGLVMPTDVSVKEQVDHLVEEAVNNYGRIDVWVNNAAVSLFGRLEETPHADYEQVLNINLLGCVNGSRAAIRQFREQGHGKLINVSSMVGQVGQPYTSAYVTTKWAIRGLTECLRMELADAPNITASVVLPASIDTPIFQNAGNYTGRPVKAMTPVYPPEKVAAEIVRVALMPCREVMVGNAGRALAFLRNVFPWLGERVMREQVEKDHFDAGTPVEANSGNLFEPAAGKGAVRGGWMAKEQSSQGSVPKIVIGTLAVATLLVCYAHKCRKSDRFLRGVGRHLALDNPGKPVLQRVLENTSTHLLYGRRQGGAKWFSRD